MRFIEITDKYYLQSLKYRDHYGANCSGCRTKLKHDHLGRQQIV